MHIDCTRHAFKLCGDLLRDSKIRVRFRQGAGDLNVDRRRQAKVEYLAHHVGWLRKELDIREPAWQLLAERLQVTSGRMMRFVESYQDFAIRRSNRHVVTQSDVDGVRNANVVCDYFELVSRDHLADVILDRLEVEFGFLNPRSRRSPHMDPQLPRINCGEEVATDERVQKKRCGREAQK